MILEGKFGAHNSLGGRVYRTPAVLEIFRKGRALRRFLQVVKWWLCLGGALGGAMYIRYYRVLGESKADAHFDTRDEIPRYTTVFARAAIGRQKNLHIFAGDARRTSSC